MCLQYKHCHPNVGFARATAKHSWCCCSFAQACKKYTAVPTLTFNDVC